MSTISVQLSDCEFFERKFFFRVSLLTYSIYMEMLFGNPLCFPPSFSLLPQSVDGGERVVGGMV